MKVIIYGSRYGTAKEYALELSRRTESPAMSFEEVGSLEDYDTIVYIGSLYAGGVLGMKKTFKKVSLKGQRLIIVTVGLADPADPENISNILASMEKQLPAELFAKAEIFHLRGGIDYSKLNFKHRTMMNLLYKKVVKIPENQRTGEIRALIDTYNSCVSFVDMDSLSKIEEVLKNDKYQ